MSSDNPIDNPSDKVMKCSVSVAPADPLWKRIPSHDEEGRMLSDLMVLIPRLKDKPQQFIQNIIKEIEIALHYHKQHIVFADLNLNLNLLLISFESKPGIRNQIADAIYARVPEAKMVTHL
ncbi:MAG: hypothetical protein OQK73_01300 [Gammaproteobacteria bacterium]|nr:hypothetical protein [Gammaproteobacteria bacterium]